MNNGMSRPKSVTAVIGLLVIKALLGIWGSYALLTASPEQPRRFLTEVIEQQRTSTGSLLLGLAILSIIIALGLARLRPWARILAFVTEGLSVLISAARIAQVPFESLLSIALALSVISLLLLPASARAFALTNPDQERAE